MKSLLLLMVDFQEELMVLLWVILLPKAYVGGPLAILENGDEITIDAQSNTLSVALSEKEITHRMNNLKITKKIPTKGVLSKYSKSVQSASLGAITD